MRFVELLCAFCSVAVLAHGMGFTSGCSGDHGRLKKEAPAGGAGGAGGGDGGDGGVMPITGGSGPGGIVEPPGPPQLTIVNGTVDEDAIRVCFVPYPAGPSNEMPWPDQGRLNYARGEAVAIEDVIPSSSDIEVMLVAGPLASSNGSTCATLMDDTPAGVLVRSVGILPESVFTTEKSIVLVTAGCVGGRDHEHESQELICGLGYANDQPTATLVAGFMSRLTDSSGIPLQFVQASLGVTDVQLRIKPGNSDTAQPILTEWTFGAIAPYPPYMSLGTQQLGSVGQTSIELYLTGSQSPLSSTVWSQAFANSALLEDEVSNGVGLTFVGVGPTPTFGAGPWWNDFTYTVVLSDP